MRTPQDKANLINSQNRDNIRQASTLPTRTFSRDAAFVDAIPNRRNGGVPRSNGILRGLDASFFRYQDANEL